MNMVGPFWLKICISAPIFRAQARFEAPRGPGPHFGGKAVKNKPEILHPAW